MKARPLSAFYLASHNEQPRNTCKDCMRSQDRARYRELHPVDPLMPIEYPEIDPAFGHWLAGFVDGEGSFCISAPRNAFICKFSLSLRKDDEAVLLECMSQAGVGYVADNKRKQRHTNERPTCRWDVGGKQQCLRLVWIFDRHPLRAKKARDFAIWRKAVIEWNFIDGRRERVDWSCMADLRDQLNEGRRYVCHPTEADHGTRSRAIQAGPPMQAV
jgi:hypothetical protein